MKKHIIVAILAIVAVACGPSEKDKEIANLKEQVNQLKNQNASLRNGDRKLKATVAEYNKFLKEVESNLSKIDENKTMIAKLGEGQKGDVKENINVHINTIKALVENSKLRLLAMDKSLMQLRKESGDKSDEILASDKNIKSLTRELLAKDAEMEEMDNELEGLEEMYEMELQNSQELTAIINKAFYYAGTKKELMEKGIVTKEGGFIGLGRVKVVNANAPDMLFKQIMKNKTEEIMLEGKDAKLLSTHAEGSYEWQKEGNNIAGLTILDSDAFWKNGNYLVVELER